LRGQTNESIQFDGDFRSALIPVTGVRAGTDTEFALAMRLIHVNNASGPHYLVMVIAASR
jgi:hypothetical protein